MARIGTVIDGKYEILTKLGRGGMSEVYLAMDKRLNKQWAIKEITKQARDQNNSIVVQSLIAEANLMKKLDHPSLPRIVDIIDTGQTIYVIMDYIEGEPLSRILEEYGAQPQDIVIEWAKQICEVLEYLHTRTPPIIYRDMKPANVMLKPDGNIKLIDFGIAREYKENSLADTVSLGTKGYAAPEQFGGKGQTDVRTDVYCLGVTMYHLVTGQNPCEPPYELYPIRHWDPTLSGGLERIIQKCTQLNPADRYQSCAEVLYALNHYEKIDDIYRKKQKKKLLRFIVFGGMSLLFLIVGLLGQTIEKSVNNSNYLTVMAQAEKAALSNESAELYKEAITIMPSAIDAYMGLIDAYKSDAVFSVEEEEQFKQIINVNMNDLHKSEDYAKLAFAIGKLYWYYYDYGKESEEDDNQVTRIKSSIQWFSDVIEYGSPESDPNYVIAQIYEGIGVFNRDITLNIEEASDNGLYKPYWTNIKTLLNVIESNPDESEIVKLELYKLVMSSIEIYVRKFKADGIAEGDIREVYELVKNNTEELLPMTDKTQQIKDYITDRFDDTLKAIDNAFI